MDIEEKEDLFLLDIMKNSEKQDISKSIKQLMTYEGRIAGIYLENLTTIFNQLNPEFNFTGRKNKTNSRNYNASDEINALLNYGYTILESEIRKAINAIGLDYSIGFHHGFYYRFKDDKGLWSFNEFLFSVRSHNNKRGGSLDSVVNSLLQIKHNCFIVFA